MIDLLIATTSIESEPSRVDSIVETFVLALKDVEAEEYKNTQAESPAVNPFVDSLARTTTEAMEVEPEERISEGRLRQSDQARWKYHFTNGRFHFEDEPPTDVCKVAPKPQEHTRRDFRSICSPSVPGGVNVGCKGGCCLHSACLKQKREHLGLTDAGIDTGRTVYTPEERASPVDDRMKVDDADVFGPPLHLLTNPDRKLFTVPFFTKDLSVPFVADELNEMNIVKSRRKVVTEGAIMSKMRIYFTGLTNSDAFTLYPGSNISKSVFDMVTAWYVFVV